MRFLEWIRSLGEDNPYEPRVVHIKSGMLEDIAVEVQRGAEKQTALSQAVSLKRIADALERLAKAQEAKS